MTHNWRSAAIVAALMIGLPTLALAQQGPPYYGHGMMWDGGWFHMLFGFLMMILFLGVIVVLAVLGIRWLGGAEHSPFRHPPGGGQRAALEILKERLAKGEIEVAEFEERKRALGD